jgi:hypothetical protein
VLTTEGPDEAGGSVRARLLTDPSFFFSSRLQRFFLLCCFCWRDSFEAEVDGVAIIYSVAAFYKSMQIIDAASNK